MSDTDRKVRDLLNSPVGCAFLISVEMNGLTPEDVSDPETSINRAAFTIEQVRRHTYYHEAAVSGVLEMGKSMQSQARALIEHPGVAWWFEPVGLNRQAWLSIYGTLDKFIYGTPPNTDRWSCPQNPSSRWERYAQKPLSNQHTSTLYGPCLTSQLIAYDQRVGDHYCDFPLAWWAMRFPQDVRVFEIHGPSDWHDLCVQYPARGTEDDRLVPNWGAISEEWDGVHLSFGGMLTTEQGRYESSVGWTMLESWQAEQTYWLRNLEVDSKRLSDYDRTVAEGPEGYDFPDFLDEDGSAGLLRRI